MSVQNTLLVDGTDLRTVAGLQIAGDMNLYAPGTRRGSHIVVPGRRGQLGVELPYDAYQFDVPVIVTGPTREDMVANLIALAPLLSGTNGLVTLERRLAAVGGGYTSWWARGQFAAGTALSLINERTGQTSLTFVNLDGAWTTGDLTDPSASWSVP